MKGQLLRGVRSALALLGLLLVAVTTTPVVVWMGGALAGSWEDTSGDTLIVLTGSSLENSVLGESSYWRSIYAVLLWRKENYQTIWITGWGNEAGSAPTLMRDFLVAHGVPAERIRLETASSNTQASARAMAGLMAGEASRKVLLTSDYHMFRSRRLFAREGLPVATVPIPDAQKRGGRAWTRWQAFLDTSEELVKIVWYGGRGML
jgi:uncharacterized SAM-binding protein YcdF (DUF218 family)